MCKFVLIILEKCKKRTVLYKKILLKVYDCGKIRNNYLW